MEKQSKSNRIRSQVAANFALVILGILFSLSLAEAGVRALSAVLDRPPIVSSDLYAGWAGRKNLHKVTKSYSNGRFDISTDQYGRRISYPTGQAGPDSAPAILIVGDSFAQGIGVDDQETYAWRIAEDMPRYNIINLGVAGYGTDQELLKLEEFFKKNTDVIVRDIVVLVYENDFKEVQRSFDPFLGRSKPLFNIARDKLFRNNYQLTFEDHLMDISRLAWLINSKRSSFFKPVDVPMDSGIDLVVACLNAIRTLADNKGVRLNIFAHRRLQGSAINDSLWKEFLDKSKVIDITEAIRADSGPNPVGFDGAHWSAEGHRRVAVLIQKFIASDNTNTSYINNKAETDSN